MRKIWIKWLQLRMWLNIDPWARAARRRMEALDSDYERIRIRRKAEQFQAEAHTTIIAEPVRDAMDEGGETVFDLPKRIATPAPERNIGLSTQVTTDGIEVAVFDPTDQSTVELMTRFGMGNVQDHERSALFQHQVDSTPPEEINLEWDGDEADDPFAGIKNLG